MLVDKADSVVDATVVAEIDQAHPAPAPRGRPVTTKEEARRELERRRAFALGQGGPERVERHHASGRTRLLARAAW